MRIYSQAGEILTNSLVQFIASVFTTNVKDFGMMIIYKC